MQFSGKFWPNNRLAAAPWGWCPLLWEILDPPLYPGKERTSLVMNSTREQPGNREDIHISPWSDSLIHSSFSVLKLYLKFLKLICYQYLQFVIQVVISTRILSFCAWVYISSLRQVHNSFLYLLQRNTKKFEKFNKPKKGKTRLTLWLVHLVKIDSLLLTHAQYNSQHIWVFTKYILDQLDQLI